MASSNSALTREEWSSFAPSFMKLAADGPGVLAAQNLISTVNKILPFSEGKTVIDMGCGPGLLTHEILAKHADELAPTARLVAADSSDGILDQIRSRLAREVEGGKSEWSRVEVVQSDVHDCEPFADGSVSHMLAAFVLFLVPRQGEALASIKRVLAPGGVLAVASWQQTEWSELMECVGKVRPDLAIPGLPEIWATESGNGTILRQAGFRDIHVESVQCFMPFNDHDEISRFLLLKTPPGARACAQMTEDEVSKTRDLMVAHLKSKYPEAPNRMAGTALVGTCRK